MKEFEKLWKSNHPVYDTGSDTIGHYNIAKEYYKAALEWTLSNWTGETDMMTLGMIIRDEVSNC